MKVPFGFLATDQERLEIESLLGRKTEFPFRVAARHPSGDAVVIENFPVSESNRPMPTWFWLVDREISQRVSRLESEGGVKEAERTFPPLLLAAVSRIYTAGRDDLVAGLTIPSQLALAKGVGGARAGVKCLHAQLAYSLAGGWNPVGSWVATRIALEINTYTLL